MCFLVYRFSLLNTHVFRSYFKNLQVIIHAVSATVSLASFRHVVLSLHLVVIAPKNDTNEHATCCTASTQASDTFLLYHICSSLQNSFGSDLNSDREPLSPKVSIMNSGLGKWKKPFSYRKPACE